MSVADLQKRLEGTLALDNAAADPQDLFYDFHITFQKSAADAMAADASTVFSFKAAFDFTVVALDVCPVGTLTADNTNNAVLTLGKADGAGGSSTAIVAYTTNVAAGNWAADTFKSTTVTAANANVNDGQIVTLKITKGGSGVVVPISNYTLRCRKR